MLKWQNFRRIQRFNFIKICGVSRAVVYAYMRRKAMIGSNTSSVGVPRRLKPKNKNKQKTKNKTRRKQPQVSHSDSRRSNTEIRSFSQFSETKIIQQAT